MSKIKKLLDQQKNIFKNFEFYKSLWFNKLCKILDKNNLYIF